MGQLCKEIAPHLVAKVVRQVEARLGEHDTARKLDVWSHTVSLIYCHSTNCLSLNDVCDGLSFHAYELNAIRNAVPPTRSTLSRANRERSSEYIKAIYEAVAEDLKARHPKFFGRGERCFFRLPKRFKRAVRAIDSTTIELIANCMDWAQHRRRKAAAKIHLSLDPGSFLPVRIIVEPAKGHDANYMVELCAGMKAGETAVFDKAYVAYSHLDTLTERGICWVTRAKDNARFRTVRNLRKGSRRNGGIVFDKEVVLVGQKSRSRYPGHLRLVRAWVKDSAGDDKLLTFLTNNFEWTAGSVCDLYRSRWAIETFFKEIKQTLQLKTFIGYSRNAIEWQLWSAMLTYLLLRLKAWMTNWRKDFKHFFTLVKGVVWSLRNLAVLISGYGTAKRLPRADLCPSMPYLPGFEELQFG